MLRGAERDGGEYQTFLRLLVAGGLGLPGSRHADTQRKMGSGNAVPTNRVPALYQYAAMGRKMAIYTRPVPPKAIDSVIRPPAIPTPCLLRMRLAGDGQILLVRATHA